MNIREDRLRVGIDAYSLKSPNTGIARYVSAMLAEMLTFGSNIDFLLYSPARIAVTLPRGNWELREEFHPAIASAWVQGTLPRLLARDRVDAYWAQGHMLPVRACHRLRRVLTIHDLAPFVAPRTMAATTRAGMRMLLGFATRAADVVVSVSNATARDAKRHLGLPRSKIRTIYPGRARQFSPMPDDAARSLLASDFGISGDFLLSVGTVEPRKGHLTLLAALTQMPDAPMLVHAGGVGWRTQAIVRRMNDMERSGRLRRLHSVSDQQLRALYSAARIFVFPSFYEGFGSPVVEAMSCGCPVLCSWSSSLPEVGGPAAEYFHNGDSHSLSEKAMALLRNPDRLRRMSVAGQVQSAKFSYGDAARRMLKILGAVDLNEEKLQADIETTALSAP